MSLPELPNNVEIEILIVEDSPTQLEALKYLLEEHAFRVIPARNGREGLALMHQRHPELVISDVLMPEMDGYTLCAEIKKHEELKKIPVILVTSLSGPQDVIKGLQCGADNFIKKPYDQKYLLSRIRYVLANQELRKHSSSQMGVEIYVAGKKYFITSGRQQILDLLMSTYEEALHLNEELTEKQEELTRLYENLEFKIGERTAALALEVEVRKKAELNAMQFCLETNEAIRTRDEFFLLASHELKTPLTTLLLRLQILKRQVELSALRPVPIETLEEACRSSIAQVHTLAALVENLLDVSRISAGEFLLREEEFNLVESVRNVINYFSKEFIKANCPVEVIAPSTIVGKWDRMRLEQVLNNLVSNAMKYGAGKRVVVSVEQERDVARISVQDFGIGIAPENQKRIFERFERAVSPFSYGGLGVGLYITREIVEAHSGSIQVKSIFQEGATFTVTLPIRSSAAKQNESQ